VNTNSILLYMIYKNY